MPHNTALTYHPALKVWQFVIGITECGWNVAVATTYTLSELCRFFLQFTATQGTRREREGERILSRPWKAWGRHAGSKVVLLYRPGHQKRQQHVQKSWATRTARPSIYHSSPNVIISLAIISTAVSDGPVIVVARNQQNSGNPTGTFLQPQRVWLQSSTLRELLSLDRCGGSVNCKPSDANCVRAWASWQSSCCCSHVMCTRLAPTLPPLVYI